MRLVGGELGVDVRREQGVVVLEVRGELDLYSAPWLRARGPELVSAGLNGAPRTGDEAAWQSSASVPMRSHSAMVVLDLSEVPFVDSAGMGSIVAVLLQARRHGARLSLAGVNQHLGQMLHLMGLTKILTVYATVDDAVASAVHGEPSAAGEASP